MTLDAATIAEHVKRVETDGYTIVENAIDLEFIDEIATDLARLERDLDVKPAGNGFEGAATLRVYNLLKYGKVWEKIPVHPNVLPIIEGVLDNGCLVSSLSSINILPGEIAQPIHADDQLIPIPKPHPPTVCNSMWAITDFTEENGATRIIPGTHLYDHSPNYGQAYDSIPAEMAKGSVLIWPGSLWHGGGANRSSANRIGIAMNYCAGYIRQQENQQLGLPPSLVKTFEPRLQQLVGYGIYTGLIGHIDKQSPAKVFFGEGAGDMVWDAI